MGAACKLAGVLWVLCGMPNFCRFMRLYWTELVQGDYGKIIVDPVRLEVFRGPREYDVLVPVSPRAVSAQGSSELLRVGQMQVPEGRTYIEVIARTEQVVGTQQYCEDQIDRVVAQLSAILSPYLFTTEVWRGWLSDKRQVLGEAWFALAEQVNFSPHVVQGAVHDFGRALRVDPDIDARFTLMSKLFARAVATEPGEERFLWLWTVLEVFPMRGTSDIQPIGRYLSQVLGRPAAQVKEKLGIGRLFGARSRLVHDGKLPYDKPSLAIALNKLEAIDRVVIRALGGLAYSGELDTFPV